MRTIRKANDRFLTEAGWLKSYHTFSFGEHYDPAHMGFSALRVINEDWVQAGRGFGTHPHRDMEIITYILDGELQHKDSLGSGGVIRPGEIQRMSAGTGVAHSEFNPSQETDVHLLQIWIMPSKPGFPPSYEQKKIELSSVPGALTLIASPDGDDGSVKINQAARVYAGKLTKGEVGSFTNAADRSVWLQVAKGSVAVDGVTLEAGDGMGVREVEKLNLSTSESVEFLLFDLPR